MRAKLIIVLRYDMISSFLSSFCAESFEDNCFSSFEADAPALSVHAEEKVLLSQVSYILFLYVIFDRFMVLVGLATAFRATLPAG